MRAGAGHVALPEVAIDAAAAARFAELALKCVHQEYPNKIAHTLAGDADVRPPRELYPGVPWLLRLAFRRARPLAARAARAQLPECRLCARSAGGTRAKPHAGKHRGRSRLSAASRPRVVRAALWTRLAAAALRRVALLEGPQAQEWARNLVPLESRSRRAHQALAAGFVLPDSRRRTRSDRVFVRLDLGLGGSGRRCGDAHAARGCGATFLRRRPQLPAELRAFGPGFSFAVPRRGGLHAPSARSRGIHALADNLPAGDPEECARRVAADGDRDQSLQTQSSRISMA